MARLIDADSFIEDIKTEIINLKMNGLMGTPRPCDELYDFIDRINEQPTAYDVDKVVEQLKSKSYDSGICSTIATSTSVNIVKGGGIDG